ncbi:hypothetical protein T06_15453 [Trichinella sp. T6]|nr:hypothetical protein T06_15453 [Trichinella sp. T6]
MVGMTKQHRGLLFGYLPNLKGKLLTPIIQSKTIFVLGSWSPRIL